jgi:hypothetical protein
MALKIVSASVQITNSMALINNSSSTAVLGTVIGFAQSLTSFGRAVGPFVAGACWTASFVMNLPYPPAIVSVVVCGITFHQSFSILQISRFINDESKPLVTAKTRPYT